MKLVLRYSTQDSTKHRNRTSGQHCNHRGEKNFHKLVPVMTIDKEKVKQNICMTTPPKVVSPSGAKQPAALHKWRVRTPTGANFPACGEKKPSLCF